MCIERFLETVERFLVKYEELTIHDDFFCTLTGRFKNKADPVNTENFSGCINKIPLLRIIVMKTGLRSAGVTRSMVITPVVCEAIELSLLGFM